MVTTELPFCITSPALYGTVIGIVGTGVVVACKDIGIVSTANSLRGASTFCTVVTELAFSTVPPAIGSTRSHCGAGVVSAGIDVGDITDAANKDGYCGNGRVADTELTGVIGSQTVNPAGICKRAKELFASYPTANRNLGVAKVCACKVCATRFAGIQCYGNCRSSAVAITQPA